MNDDSGEKCIRIVRKSKLPSGTSLNQNLTANSALAHHLAIQFVKDIDDNRARIATKAIFSARILVTECLLANFFLLDQAGGSQYVLIRRESTAYVKERLSYSAILMVTDQLCLLGYLERFAPLKANGPDVTKYCATEMLTEMLAPMTPEDFGHIASETLTAKAA